jgi:toxin CcdB
MTDNLSGVVESLLADFLERERKGHLDKARKLVRLSQPGIPSTASGARLPTVLDALMAQFDVHRNIGKRRDDIPFVVLVQSAIFEAYRRRVVVPLVRRSTLGTIDDARFNPTFKVGRIAVVLHPLEIASVAKEQLGEFVGSLAAEGDRIINALDELLTRAWG